ncbi:MAG: hypothetical protein MJY99_04935 [Fibrobacter sp.]|nr:hypothetical protein [Fibrobacter sp.]
MKFRIYFALTLAMGFMACTDYQSEWEDDNQVFAQGGTESAKTSTGTKTNVAASTVQPSGTYDCRMFKCSSTDFLSKTMLEGGYGEILDARDNQVYKTIMIKKQVWMAQNLNYAPADGNAKDGVASWCYGDDNNNCAKYGRLYTWSAAMDMDAAANTGKVVVDEKAQGICPKGWRVPTYADWVELSDAVDADNDDEDVGNSLKSAASWSGTFNDTFGFSAIAAGERSAAGAYGNEKSLFASWINEQGDNGVASVWTIAAEEAGVAGLSFNNKAAQKSEGHSLRCILAK